MLQISTTNNRTLERTVSRPRRHPSNGPQTLFTACTLSIVFIFCPNLCPSETPLLLNSTLSPATEGGEHTTEPVSPGSSSADSCAILSASEGSPSPPIAGRDLSDSLAKGFHRTPKSILHTRCAEPLISLGPDEWLSWVALHNLFMVLNTWARVYVPESLALCLLDLIHCCKRWVRICSSLPLSKLPKHWL